MKVSVKICGLKTVEALEAAKEADYVGFVFYPPSPRHLGFDEAARLVSHSQVPAVAVLVDPDDETLEALFASFRPAFLQLHGEESPQRVGAIRARYGVAVIKALRVAQAEDIARADTYAAADMLLFDAAVAGMLPGGTGQSFDWRVLAGRSFGKPWFLSGGIDAENVENALAASGATMLDISSRLESAPGVKDPQRIEAFLKKVKNL